MTALSYLRLKRAFGRALVAAVATFAIAFAPVPNGTLSPSEALAQDPPEVLPASLHMRLGVAADGYRTGGTIFIGAQRAAPHHVVTVAMTREEAEQALDGLPDREAYGIFEVLTERDFEREDMLLVIGHQPITWCRPQDGAAGGPCWALNTLETSVPIDLIERFVLQVFVRDRPEPLEWVFGGRDIDALFLTYSAYEKFYGPYIAQIYGAEVAEQIRIELEEYVAGLPIR